MIVLLEFTTGHADAGEMQRRQTMRRIAQTWSLAEIVRMIETTQWPAPLMMSRLCPDEYQLQQSMYSHRRRVDMSSGHRRQFYGPQAIQPRQSSSR